MQVIEANYSFWKSSAGTIFFSAALFAYYLFAPAKYYHFAVYVILGISLLVAATTFFWQISAPKPRIRIDSEGITDNRLSIGFVPWAAIECAKLQKRNGQRYIAITVKDGANVKERFGKRAKFDRIMLGNDITIRFGDMDVSADDALVLVSKYLEANQNTNEL